MTRRFPARFSMPSREFLKEAYLSLSGKKERRELWDAFGFLKAWTEYLTATHGELLGISHLSPPRPPCKRTGCLYSRFLRWRVWRQRGSPEMPEMVADFVRPAAASKMA